MFIEIDVGWYRETLYILINVMNFTFTREKVQAYWCREASM